MGIYVSPGSRLFERALNSRIYVDKTGMIARLNEMLNSEQCYVCISRPRRFGKSMTVNMLAAYYDEAIDSSALFSGLKIASEASYAVCRNRFPVVSVNMQEFLSRSETMEEMLQNFQKEIIWELKKTYPAVEFYDERNLSRCMADVYQYRGIPFVILIDEWDCIFREYKKDTAAQEKYLDFLRNWLKDKAYIALAYMTGILPIKKYGTHSALNMFTEFSMTNPGIFAEYVGFTEREVEVLCRTHQMSLEQTREWYNGYHFPREKDVYAPKSVVDAMLFQQFDDYWNRTETYEALKTYIELDYSGLREIVARLLAGEAVPVNIGKFVNDMTSFQDADDVLTLLIHLGYLAYDFEHKTVQIPNREIRQEFCNAVEGAGNKWREVVTAIHKSAGLLQAIWQMDEETVAAGMEEAHYETSILQYHDENALSYTVSLALYAAREYYTIVREMPSGKDFADLIFIPYRWVQKPAMIVELKWNHNVSGAIRQIEDQKYVTALKNYQGDILLVAISYHKATKRHTCRIKKVRWEETAGDS